MNIIIAVSRELIPKVSEVTRNLLGHALSTYVEGCSRIAHTPNTHLIH